MNFRISLQNWLLIMVLLLLTLALTGVYGFYNVGTAALTPIDNVPIILRQTQEMNRALEQQERFLIRALTGEHANLDYASFSHGQQIFETALDKVSGSATTEMSANALERLQNQWQQWQQVANIFADTEQDFEAAALRDVYASFIVLKTAVDDFTYAAAEIISNAKLDVERSTRLYGWYLVFLATVAVLIALKFNHRIVQTIISPVRKMSRFIDRAILGELHLRLSLVEDEHMNALILSCNRLIENLQNVTEESRRRIRQERNLAVTLIDSLQTPTVALSPANDILLANSSARMLLSGENGNAVLNHLTNALAAEHDSFQHEDATYKVKTLRANQKTVFQGTLVQFFNAGNTDVV